MSLNKSEIREKYNNYEDFYKIEHGKHRCDCGCNEIIDLKHSHYWNGIPRYIFGHAARLRQGAKPFDQSKYYCVEDIARIAGVSDQTVRLWNRNGSIVAETSIGRKNLYRKDSIDRFLSMRPERPSFDANEYYTVQELKKMGVSRGKLRLLVRAGHIHEPRHHARKTYYLKEEIDIHFSEIFEDGPKTSPHPRVSLALVNNLKGRITELEDRVRILEDCLLQG